MSENLPGLPATNDLTALLTESQIAARWGCDRRAVRKAIADGILIRPNEDLLANRLARHYSTAEVDRAKLGVDTMRAFRQHGHVEPKDGHLWAHERTAAGFELVDLCAKYPGQGGIFTVAAAGAEVDILRHRIVAAVKRGRLQQRLEVFGANGEKLRGILTDPNALKKAKQELGVATRKIREALTLPSLRPISIRGDLPIAIFRADLLRLQKQMMHEESDTDGFGNLEQIRLAIDPKYADREDIVQFKVFVAESINLWVELGKVTSKLRRVKRTMLIPAAFAKKKDGSRTVTSKRMFQKNQPEKIFEVAKCVELWRRDVTPFVVEIKKMARTGIATKKLYDLLRAEGFPYSRARMILKEAGAVTKAARPGVPHLTTVKEKKERGRPTGKDAAVLERDSKLVASWAKREHGEAASNYAEPFDVDKSYARSLIRKAKAQQIKENVAQ